MENEKQNSNRSNYTIAEAAEILRCCTKSVLNRLKHGQLRGVKNGRRWLVPHKAIQDFIERGGTLNTG